MSFQILFLGVILVEIQNHMEIIKKTSFSQVRGKVTFIHHGFPHYIFLPNLKHSLQMTAVFPASEETETGSRKSLPTLRHYELVICK